MSDNSEIAEDGDWIVLKKQPLVKTAAGGGAGNIFATSHSGEVFVYDTRMDHDTFDNLLRWATEQKASDITFQSGAPVRAEIAGRWVKITKRSVNHPEMEGIIRAIYGDNGPGELNDGYDLDPSYEVKNTNGIGRLRFRVNITPGRMIGGIGYQMTIRTLPTQPIDIKKLGIEPEILENFRPPQGLNLITGPTGSGKSTLMSSMIRYLCEFEDANEKVIEFSKPIEYVYDGLDFPSSFIFQSEVGVHLRPRYLGDDGENNEWNNCVRNSLRRKPDIIVLGEARDKATIEGCVQTSLTGHLVISTMHTIGVPETIRRAIMPFPGAERRSIAVDLLECLNLCVTQLLLDRVGGGKVGCREYLLFDRHLRRALAEVEVDEWPRAIRAIMLEGKVAGKYPIVGRTMASSAADLLDQGLISKDTYEWIASRTTKDE